MNSYVPRSTTGGGTILSERGEYHFSTWTLQKSGLETLGVLATRVARNLTDLHVTPRT